MICQRCKSSCDKLTRIHAPGRRPFDADLCGTCVFEWDQVEARLRQRAPQNVRVTWSWGFGGTSSTTTTTGGNW